jgi:hypothetical protein
MMVSFAASSAVLRSRHGFTDAQYGSIFLPQVVLAAAAAIGSGALLRVLDLRQLLALSFTAMALSSRRFIGFYVIGAAPFLMRDVHETVSAAQSLLPRVPLAVRAAMDALLDFGRPKGIQLCVLIDRGLRELPIQANFIGKYVPTREDEMVEVRLREVDQMDRVLLVDKNQS